MTKTLIDKKSLASMKSYISSMKGNKSEFTLAHETLSKYSNSFSAIENPTIRQINSQTKALQELRDDVEFAIKKYINETSTSHYSQEVKHINAIAGKVSNSIKTCRMESALLNLNRSDKKLRSSIQTISAGNKEKISILKKQSKKQLESSSFTKPPLSKQDFSSLKKSINKVIKPFKMKSKIFSLLTNKKSRETQKKMLNAIELLMKDLEGKQQNYPQGQYLTSTKPNPKKPSYSDYLLSNEGKPLKDRETGMYIKKLTIKSSSGESLFMGQIQNTILQNISLLASSTSNKKKIKAIAKEIDNIERKVSLVVANHEINLIETSSEIKFQIADNITSQYKKATAGKVGEKQTPPPIPPRAGRMPLAEMLKKLNLSSSSIASMLSKGNIKDVTENSFERKEKVEIIDNKDSGFNKPRQQQDTTKKDLTTSNDNESPQIVSDTESRSPGGP